MGKDRASRLEEKVVFARVIETGSLTNAARALGTTRSAVSKALARLEEHLGTTLLHRTTRELRATVAGQAVYVHCARLVEEADAADHAAGALSEAPHGPLRVSCALSLGLQMAPAFPRFAARYPAVSLELELSEAVVDLVRTGVDVAIRLGRLTDSSLVARKLVSYRRVLCASPAYLEEHPALRRLEDLAKHNCLLRIGHDQWQFRRGKKIVAMPVQGNYRVDTAELLRQAALAGRGITLLPSFLIAGDLAAGRLSPLLEAHELGPAGIYAVYPQHRYLSRNVRAFVDFLVEEFARLE